MYCLFVGCYIRFGSVQLCEDEVQHDWIKVIGCMPVEGTVGGRLMRS